MRKLASILQYFLLIFIVFIVYAFFSIILSKSIYAQKMHFGVGYSQQIFDFIDQDYAGLGPDGSAFGGFIGFEKGRSMLELGVKYGRWTNEFTYDNWQYSVGATDLIFTLGIRTQLIFSFLYGRLGISNHSLSATVNGRSEPEDAFEADILRRLNGNLTAGYFGVGVKIELQKNVLDLYADFIVHKFTLDTLYDIEFSVIATF